MSTFKFLIQEIHELICQDVDGNCDECPRFISKHCKAADTEAKAPKGWIKLNTMRGDIYINASKIVALTHMMRPDGADASAKAITKIYTVGAEDTPWMVDESIDDVIEKIEKA